MNRKKLINKMILAAAVVFIISGAVCILEYPFIRAKENKIIAENNKKIARLIDHYQKYLDETAGKISGASIDPKILSQIKSDIFKEIPDTKLYLWMSDVKGEFIFGVPAPVFSRLNKTFDKYRPIIEKDGYYLDRNDFLLKLVNKHDKIRFSQFEGGGQRRFEESNWRFYKEHFYPGDYSGGIRLALSSPVIDEEKQVVGDLYLKINQGNEGRIRNYYYRNIGFFTATLFEIFHVLCGVSGLLLWFLLPTWLYIDARQRDVKNVGMWIGLTIISLGFAFIIYLITRPPELKSFHCPECREELNGTKAFCPHCGFDLSSTFCPECQYPVKPGWQFCPNCRNDMKQKPGQEPPAEDSTESPAEENNKEEK